MNALLKYWVLFCLPAFAGADELRFDSRGDWEKWRLPMGAVELDRTGTIRPTPVQKNINAVLNAGAFDGGIRKAGSNERDARFVTDGNQATGWAPDPEDPPENWYIEVDLGRVVSAHAITFVFDEAAAPFELFHVLLSGGEPLQGSGNIPIEGTLVYKIKDIIRQNEQHRVTYAPGEVLEYTAIRAVRIEVLDFEPGGRLTEVEVNAIGDNVALHMAANNGSARMILDPDVTREEIAIANVLPLVDGAVFTRFLDKREARYSYDTWWEFTVDLGATYWLDMVRMYGWTALRPIHTGTYSVRDAEGNIVLDENGNHVSRNFNIRTQELRNSIDAMGRRDFTLKFYEVLTSDGSLAPDGSYIWTKHFSGKRTLRDQRLGVADHHFDLVRARLFRIRWLAWDAACNEGYRLQAAASQGMSRGFGPCYGHGTADEYQAFGEGYPADVELTSGPIELSGGKNLMSISWEAETPPGTRVEIRSRTGNHIRVDTTEWFDNKDPPQPVSQRRWNSLKKQKRAGPVTEIRNAGDGWSPWSNIYASSGQAFQSPSPRQAMELSVRLVGDSPSAVASLDWLAVEFSAPLADSAFGEIFPTQVLPGEPTEFSYYIRPMGSTRQLDRVAVSSSVPVRFVEVFLNGNPVEVDEPDSLAGGFQITFPRTIRRNELVEVRFESSVFVQGTRFEAFLGNSNRDDIRQRVDPGDADELIESSTIVVRLPVSGDLITDLRLEPAVLTPNGDGLNDEFDLTFNLANVLEPRSIQLRVFDLSGRLVYAENRDAVAGQQRFGWDGRSGGRRVAPGAYLVELRLASDARDEAAHRILPVAY